MLTEQQPYCEEFIEQTNKRAICTMVLTDLFAVEKNCNHLDVH